MPTKEDSNMKIVEILTRCISETDKDLMEYFVNDSSNIVQNSQLQSEADIALINEND